jgi:hypothetical protein
MVFVSKLATWLLLLPAVFVLPAKSSSWEERRHSPGDAMVDRQQMPRAAHSLASTLQPLLPETKAAQIAAMDPKEHNSPYPMNSTAYKRVSYWFSGQPLNRTEYEARNWIWLRCRGQIIPAFDLGGAWTADGVRIWKNALKNKRCLLNNWSMLYYNGQDWGDAAVDFVLSKPTCGLRTAVLTAEEALAPHLERERRTLHIWNCPGLQDRENVRNEKEVMLWQQGTTARPGGNGIVGGGVRGGGQTGYRGPHVGVVGNDQQLQDVLNKGAQGAPIPVNEYFGKGQ